MGTLIQINSHRIFTEDEALDLLPIVKRITERAAAEAEEIQEQIKWTPQDEPLFIRLRGRLQFIVNRWAAKIQRLGCNARGIWLVDFDAGEGWYSWRHGDEDLTFFHSSRSVPEDLPVQGELLT